MAYETTDIPIPVVVIRHPIQNITPDEMEERAQTIADAAVRLLKGQPC